MRSRGVIPSSSLPQQGELFSSTTTTPVSSLNLGTCQRENSPKSIIRSGSISIRLQRNILAGLLIIIFLIISWELVIYVTFKNSSGCDLYFGPYMGPQYYNKESGSVGTPHCLIESKWLKLSMHSVRFPGSSTTFHDWLWIDYHDRINVLVEDESAKMEKEEEKEKKEDNRNDERRFLVFRQTKYALEGRSSFALVGGIIEPGEHPEDAARREVAEEMNNMQCDNFHFLGRYRTDVNRGNGWLNSYLATSCSRQGATEAIQSKTLFPPPSGYKDTDEVGVKDTERQDLQSISLSQLRDLVTTGQFIEVQWTATVALALQHSELLQ